MSIYRLQQRIFETLRGKASPPGRRDPQDDGLTEEERRALEDEDVAALYLMGVHPVLLNGFCRAAGLGRNDYRAVLEPFDDAVRRMPRWRAR
jgi:hypothetical protein